MTKTEQAVKAADALAATSITFFGIALADLNTIVSIIAGCVAIIAGITAAWYHITKTLQLKKGYDLEKRTERQNQEDSSRVS